MSKGYVTLYSSGSEECKKIRDALNAKGVSFILVENIKEMLSKGIHHTPVLEVSNTQLTGDDIHKWIRNQ